MTDRLFIGGPENGKTHNVPEYSAEYRVTDIKPVTFPSDPDDYNLDLNVLLYHRQQVAYRVGRTGYTRPVFVLDGVGLSEADTLLREHLLQQWVLAGADREVVL